MEIQRTIYVLAVLDLERSAHFYRDVLGFAIHEIGDPGWRMLVRDHCRIMAGHCPDATPPVTWGTIPTLGTLSWMMWMIITTPSPPKTLR
jgi:catechol 2,3-dioxygenase-like lactoylglutathione lyase family enzyme